jgi:hypothetical protein
VSVSGLWRGHPITCVDGRWLYADTGEPVADAADRPCGECGRAATVAGHDGCLGTLPDVANACCGHGRDDEAYVQFADGSEIRGADARLWQLRAAL